MTADDKHEAGVYEAEQLWRATNDSVYQGLQADLYQARKTIEALMQERDSSKRFSSALAKQLLSEQHWRTDLVDQRNRIQDNFDTVNQRVETLEEHLMYANGFLDCDTGTGRWCDDVQPCMRHQRDAAEAVLAEAMRLLRRAELFTQVAVEDKADPQLFQDIFDWRKHLTLPLNSAYEQLQKEQMTNEGGSDAGPT